MGKVGSTLFGKPQSTDSHSKSGNYAYEDLSNSLMPVVNQTAGASSLMGNLLGVGGAPAQTEALNNFANSGGMQFIRDQGLNGIASNNAAKGLLQSGSTLKAMDEFSQKNASTYLGQYMQSLLGLGNLGVNAAGPIADSGRWMQEDSKGRGPKKGLFDRMSDAAKAYAEMGGGG